MMLTREPWALCVDQDISAVQVDNRQIGVCLGDALLDRERSLPLEWTDDRECCLQAGIPDARGVATKPQLAQQMWPALV